MSQTTSHVSRSRSRTVVVQPGLCAIGILTLALACVLVTADFVPPLQDYGDWVYQGFLLKLLLLGQAVPVTLKPWPVPNAIAQVLLGGSMFVLPPIVAAKAFLCAYLVLFGLVCAALTREPDGTRDGGRFLLLVLLGATNSAFWNGYVNFQVGLLILLFYVAMRRRGRGMTLPAEICFGIAMFFSHAICLAAFLLHVGWDGLLRRRLARAIAIATPALALVAWYGLANTADAPEIPAEGGGWLAFAGYKLYTLAKLGPYQNFIVNGAGDHARQPLLYAAGVLINVAFAVAFVLPLLVRIAVPAGRRLTAEALTASACLMGFLLMPSTLFGIVNIGERVLVIACVLGLLSVERMSAWQRAGAALACVAPLTVASALLVTLGVRHDTPLAADAIDRPGERTHLLFWHRAFEFQGEMRMAQRSASSGIPPELRPGFDTSILAPRHP